VLARRQERARLLIVGTYRPVEVLTRDHPLKGVKQELQLHGQCEGLALDFLTEEDVAEYLAVRFRVPSPFAGEGQDGGELGQQHRKRPPHPVPLPPGAGPAHEQLRTGRELEQTQGMKTARDEPHALLFAQYFATLPDPRRRTPRHPWLSILFIV